MILTPALVGVLLSGLYQPIQSNGPELCPHKVRVNQWSEEAFSLRVYYSGDCADQGPYHYDCGLGGPMGGPVYWACIDGLIEFQVISPTRYLWRNRAYNFEGLFELQPQP